MQRPALSLALPFSILLLAACGQESASEEPASESAAPAPGAATDQIAGNAASLWQGGAQRPLDIQSAHPNGTVLQLTSLQSRPTETVIGVRVLNGRDREIQLNRFNTRNGYIVLATGDRLYLSPPANNTRLSIPAGQTLEGELVFLGRLPPAQSAVLILNENSSTDSQHTSQPSFRIDLPVGGAGA
jgi:hypothetical protein